MNAYGELLVAYEAIAMARRDVKAIVLQDDETRLVLFRLSAARKNVREALDALARHTMYNSQRQQKAGGCADDCQVR